MLYLPIEFEGYWSLYLFPFAMISTTGGTTYAHQFYQPLEEKEQTECITKLWCLKSKNEKFEEPLRNFYKSVADTNLEIFKEDAEICSFIPKNTWDNQTLIYKSSMESKIDHFRECIRKFEEISKINY